MTVKFESGWKILPLIKIITHTVHASWALLGSTLE